MGMVSKKRKTLDGDDLESTLASPKKLKVKQPKEDDAPAAEAPAQVAPEMTSEEFRAKWKITALERSGEVPELPEAVQSFETAPFSRRIKDALATAGFAAPSPIQAQSWPIAVQGSDLVAVAKTGSGKTLAFLLPAFKIIARWSKEATSSDPPVLCLAPTRELATQIDAECKRFSPVYVV
eukprot:s2415_g5.t1